MQNARAAWFLGVVGFVTSFTVIACGDGGWGDGPPDTLLLPLPDAGAAVDATADVATADVPPGVCGQGPGNELGVGKPCTKGGKQCPQGLSCDADLDAQGVGVCIKLLCKAEADCGDHAGCCKPTGSPMSVCIHDDCLPTECAELKGN